MKVSLREWVANVLHRPSALDSTDEEQFHAYLRDLHARTLEHVEDLLVDLEDPALAQHVYDLAFSESEALPKRTHRPMIKPALLAEQTYRRYAPEGDDLAPLLRFAVSVQEYYDMLDDLVDEDVTADHEGEVILASQALVPVVLRELEKLGDEGLQYWRERAVEVLGAPLVEARRDPDPETYDELLHRQSVLFGVVTGLAALAAGEDETTVDEAERLGRTVYKHAQYVLDYEQYCSGTEDGWNAGTLHSEDAILDQLAAWEDDVERMTTGYPPERATLVRALVALDVDDWLALRDQDQRD